ncbi:MAG TPA: molecular chaperone TorD [Rhodobacteraceae bacterium]|jgi:TorA maturation chaperone TorD|nr:molecular chaperone TorD [Paracoccaceae bacterium]HBV53839.1 molecular chaperone TorD [Paracoccaceae bacterium]
MTDAAQDIRIAEEDRLRVEVYDLLAALLADPPSKERLRALGRLVGDTTPFGTAVDTLAKLARATSAATVEREFNDLFIGIGRGELLPFASYYLTGFLNEKPLATLRKDMADLSIARAPNVYEPEDNIASLMEMMAGLIDGRFGAPASLEKQREFFNRHIAPWAGHFYSDLEKARGSVFFLPVGTLGRIFIDIEREAFRLGGT